MSTTHEDRGSNTPGPSFRIMGAMSMPRLGFTANFSCVSAAFTRLGIPLHIHQGSVFWEKSATKLMEKAIAAACDYIVYVDYDSLFDVEQLRTLINDIHDNEFDAIFPVQVMRGSNQLLVSPYDRLQPIDFSEKYSRAMCGHFGLTVVRCETVKKMPKPWFVNTPNMQGDWEDGDGRADADVGFWCMLNHVGGKVYQSNRVRIGHMELMATWPTADGQMIRRTIEDFAVNGVPAEARTAPTLEQAGAGLVPCSHAPAGIQGVAA
jgi:hypothetical protein